MNTLNLIKSIILIIIWLPYIALGNYSVYEGTIGKNKVELYIEAYFKDDMNVIYIDSETHEPKGLFRCYNKKNVISISLLMNIIQHWKT